MFVCTKQLNSLQAMHKCSHAFTLWPPQVPDYDTPDGPYSEFQPEFAEAYNKKYLDIYKYVFVKCYKEITDMDRTASAVDRIELEFETAASKEANLDDLHISGCWRCLRFNPVDEAIFANLVVYLIISWASYTTYVSGEIGSTSNSTAA